MNIFSSLLILLIGYSTRSECKSPQTFLVPSMRKFYFVLIILFWNYIQNDLSYTMFFKRIISSCLIITSKMFHVCIIWAFSQIEEDSLKTKSQLPKEWTTEKLKWWISFLNFLLMYYLELLLKKRMKKHRSII